MSKPAGGLGIDVAILAGGLGTRIRGVLGETPKVLAMVAGRPFLDHALDWLAAAGAGRVVLCLGHRADHVQAWLADNASRHPLDIVVQVEPQPLGTAGALRLARPLFASDPVLVMNGDTFVDADLAAFLAAHQASRAAGSMLCVGVEDAARFGQVEIAQDGRVQRFAEKVPGSGTINAGVYLLSAPLLDCIAAAAGPSLERDVLEPAAPGTLHAHVTHGRFIDIGTPDSLAVAGTLLG